MFPSIIYTAFGGGFAFDGTNNHAQAPINRRPAAIPRVPADPILSTSALLMNAPRNTARMDIAL